MEPTIYYQCSLCGKVHELAPSDVNRNHGGRIDCSCGATHIGVTRSECSDSPGGEAAPLVLKTSTSEARTQAFRDELTSLVNRHCREAASDTPDYILALFMAQCLEAFDGAIAERSRWYGRHDSPVVDMNVAGLGEQVER